MIIFSESSNAKKRDVKAKEIVEQGMYRDPQERKVPLLNVVT